MSIRSPFAFRQKAINLVTLEDKSITQVSLKPDLSKGIVHYQFNHHGPGPMARRFSHGDQTSSCTTWSDQQRKSSTSFWTRRGEERELTSKTCDRRLLDPLPQRTSSGQCPSEWAGNFKKTPLGASDISRYASGYEKRWVCNVHRGSAAIAKVITH